MVKHVDKKTRSSRDKRIKRTRQKKPRKKRTVKRKRINAKMLKVSTSEPKSSSGGSEKYGRDATREELFKTTVRILQTKQTNYGTYTTYKNLTIDLKKMARDIEQEFEGTKSERADIARLTKILDTYTEGNSEPYGSKGEYDDIDTPCRWTRKLWAMYYAAIFKYFRKDYPEYKDMSLVDVYADLLNDKRKTKEWFEEEGY